MKRLEDIGFYTLTDERATTPHAHMHRCEMIVTTRCNFACPYCRGGAQYSRDCFGDISWATATGALVMWSRHGLKNVRFSGGEPTLYAYLPALVGQARENGVERIAISTNGSSPFWRYRNLFSVGVNDFSISLDACCAEDGDRMAGRSGIFGNVVENIRRLSELTYVTVGIVLTEDRADKAVDVIMFAHDLGVADIRIIPSAQYNGALAGLEKLPTSVLDAHPILKYRVGNLLSGRNVRGIGNEDANRCHIVRDDSVVAGHWHWPCVIYMREGGDPIGEIGPMMRYDRTLWADYHDTHADPICRKNCLDCLVDYNNLAAGIGGTP